MLEEALGECGRFAGELVGGFRPARLFPLTVLVLVLATALRNHLLIRRGLWIGRGHPLLREAGAKARASWPVMRELHDAAAGEMAVKFRLAVEGTEARGEAVWGRLLAADDARFTAALLNVRLLRADLPDGRPITLPKDRLLDWQCELPDGSVRGGFSTQAEIRICLQRRQRPPKHIAALQGRFVDR